MVGAWVLVGLTQWFSTRGYFVSQGTLGKSLGTLSIIMTSWDASGME